jgi:uncharacterized protein (DUF58 family)
MSLQPQIDDLLELRHDAHTIGIASHHPVNSILTGLYKSVFRGQGMDFEEVREYQHGDEIRNMDWRVTARTGKPYLKVFREERERTVLLCVDVGPHMSFGTRGTFKNIQAARAAALLGWAAFANHDRVGALLYGDPENDIAFFAPSRVRRSLWRVLRALTAEAAEQAGGCESMPDQLLQVLDCAVQSAPTGALIFVIGDFNRDPVALEQPLGRLCQRHEVVLLPVDDRADQELPAMGRIVFSAPDGGKLEVDTDSEEGRRHYSRRWRIQRRQLQSMGHRLGVELIPLSTEENIHQSLLKGLRLRARHMVLR